MRHQDEKYLTDVANQVLCRYQHLSFSTDISDGKAFYRNIRDLEFLWQCIEDFLWKMKPETLGAIVGFRPADKGVYEKTFFLQTLPADTLVDSTISRTGKAQLVALAAPVVIAAMYDILATAAVICAEQNTGPGVALYVPKKAMRTFVENNRPKKKKLEV